MSWVRRAERQECPRTAPIAAIHPYQGGVLVLVEAPTDPDCLRTSNLPIGLRESMRLILAAALPRRGAPRRHLRGRDLFGGPSGRSGSVEVHAERARRARRHGQTTRGLREGGPHQCRTMSAHATPSQHGRRRAPRPPPRRGRPLGPSTVVVGRLPCQCVEGAGDSIELATARPRLQAP